jgi:hypothetical protein
MSHVRTKRSIDLTIADNEWEDVSEDGSLLLGPILHINGTACFIQAHAVGDRTNGSPSGGLITEQSQVGEASTFDALNTAHEIGSAQVETTINGRQYVLFAAAHGNS